MSEKFTGYPMPPEYAGKRKTVLPHLFSFLILSAIGSVVGTLGLVNIPEGFGFSGFWPAMTLQAAGGIWFGGWGVLAAGMIGFVSNTMNHGGLFYSLGYLPSNLAQAFLPAWIFRRWRVNPSLPGKREKAVFIIGSVLLANFAGATLAACVQLMAGGLRFSQILTLYFGWLMGNGIPCLLFGIPLLIAFSPQITESAFYCRNWWGGGPGLSRSWRKFGDWPISARLLLEFFVAGVVPIMILGIAEDIFVAKEKLEAGGMLMPLMLNTSIFLALIMSGLIARRMKAKVNILARGAERLGSGDLETRIDDLGANEFGLLAGAFNDMAEKLVESREKLARNVAERERVRREMELAADIQRSFLPGAVPEITSLEIAAHMVPANLVGGDFYDFIPLPDGRWGLVIADVAGKGVPASLFMALTRSLVRIFAETRTGPSEVIAAVNDYVANDNPTATFVTLFLAYIDPGAEKLTYVNAGHNPPLLIDRRTETPVQLTATGTPIGIVEEAKYTERVVNVQPGALLILYTDGVTEAMNEAGELFGTKQFLSLFEQSRIAGAFEVLEGIEGAVRSFAGGAQQSDDITLMVVKWKEAFH